MPFEHAGTEARARPKNRAKTSIEDWDDSAHLAQSAFVKFQLPD